MVPRGSCAGEVIAGLLSRKKTWSTTWCSSRLHLAPPSLPRQVVPPRVESSVPRKKIEARNFVIGWYFWWWWNGWCSKCAASINQQVTEAGAVLKRVLITAPRSGSSAMRVGASHTVWWTTRDPYRPPRLSLIFNGVAGNFKLISLVTGRMDYLQRRACGNGIFSVLTLCLEVNMECLSDMPNMLL